MLSPHIWPAFLALLLLLHLSIPLRHFSDRCRAVNPPSFQILRIDGEGMIDDVIIHET